MKKIVILLKYTLTIGMLCVLLPACVPSNPTPIETVVLNTIDSTIVNDCTSISTSSINNVIVPATAQKQKAVTIEIDMFFTDGCGFYGGIEVKKKGKNYYFTTATGHKKCMLCTEALVPYLSFQSITFNNSGNYTLHFIRNSGSEIIRQIIVQ